ncbi:MAG: alpha-L-rhamnosidase N-terminal domain-containing protein, partial [Bacteroidota bacterium]
MTLPSDGWVARWIWCRGEERPKNFYLHVRKALQIVESVQHAFIRVTADSRYILFVNGVQCARGPARCDRRWQCIDRWDITGHLRPGLNVIAALVHHYGEWTFSYMLGRGGFFAEIEVELHDGSMMRLGTDDSWRVKPAEAWERNLPRMSIQLGYPEVFDARKEITEWTDAGFDDSNWENASVLGPAGMEPWPRFVPREIPAMMETPLQAECVIDTGEVGPVSTGHYVDILRVVWNTTHGVAYLATLVWCPAEMDAEIHAGSQEAIRLWLNGQLVISHLVTRDPAPDQEIVPIHLNEGWNTVLAKVVQGEGQSHFYFRIEGTGSDRLIYSPSKNKDNSEAVNTWWLIAPFESASVERGFETQYAPEKELDFDRCYQGKDGHEIRWISAGVTKESDLTSVIMSRESRMPSQEKGIDNIDGLIGPGTPAVAYPGAKYARYAVIDFGKEVTGYPMIEIDGANGGEIIDLGYSEALQTPEGQILSPVSGRIGIVNADRAGVHNA